MTPEQKEQAAAMIMDAAEVTMKDLAVEFGVDRPNYELLRHFEDHVTVIVDDLIEPWVDRHVGK